MASEWRTVSLADIYEFSSGLSKPSSQFGSGYPFLSFKDVFYNSAVPKLSELVQSSEQERQRCSVMRGDVFLTRTSETMDELGMSSVALVDVPHATFNGFSKRLRPKYELVVPEFARYFFRSPAFRSSVDSMSTMSTRASLNNEMLARLAITFPGNAEQVAIASILSSLDDRIEQTREASRTMEQVARAIFKSWFVDFDPVRAKAEGREPEGMDAVASALFPGDFLESELGDIPRGWSTSTLGDIASVVDCLHSKKPNRRESGKLFLQLNNIRNDGLLDLSDSYFISEDDYAKWISRIEASEGDCLITNVGRVGAVAQVPPETRAALGRNMTGLRVQANFPYPTFLIELLLSSAMREEIERKTDSGTILESLNVRSIPNLRLVRPTDDILRIFEDRIRPLRGRMELALSQIRTLANLRDNLLPRLISGKLRVPEAEKLVEAVL